MIYPDVCSDGISILHAVFVLIDASQVVGLNFISFVQCTYNIHVAEFSSPQLSDARKILYGALTGMLI